MKPIFQNTWCRIEECGTLYKLVSRSGKYNDQYFRTYDEALKFIGTTRQRVEAMQAIERHHAQQVSWIQQEDGSGRKWNYRLKGETMKRFVNLNNIAR
jgi:hypothetical protein